MSLHHFADELWLADGPVVSMMGIRFPTRMAVVRLSSGDVWLWSPIALDEDLRREIEALGRVAHIVAPNKFHHLYVEPWSKAFAHASSWAAPGLAHKRPDLQFTGELSDEMNPAWTESLDHVVFRGNVMMEEVVFFHRPSSTVLVTDVLQQHDDRTGAQGVFKKLAGLTGEEPRFPRDLRATTLRRGQARESVQAIMSWQPQRLVIAHGRCIDADAQSVLRRAFAWLL